MEKMMTGTIKGLGALALAWMTYIDKTFSPLFFVLIVLVCVDLILNFHKEGQQFAKLGSMLVSLGAPAFIASNMGNPELGKYLVAILCLAHIQLLVPQLYTKVSKIKFSSDPVRNKLDQETVDQVLQLLQERGTGAAQAVIDSAKQAGTSGSAPASEDKTGGV